MEEAGSLLTFIPDGYGGFFMPAVSGFIIFSGR